MSEGNYTPCAPTRHDSWPYSEPARRIIRRLTDPMTEKANRIVKAAVKDIDERIGQALDFSSNSESESESQSHVITNREFSFDIDQSLLPETVKSTAEEN